MEMKYLFLTLLLSVGFCGCSVTPAKSERLPAYATVNEDIKRQCLDNMSSAGMTLLRLVGQSPDQFPDILTRGLKQALAKTKIVCVSGKVGNYGARAQTAENQIEIEKNLHSLDGFFYSDNGVAMVKKYDIELRAVTFDRLMVAIAAQSYTEVLGGVDPRYDIFFKTLKLQEQQ